MDFHSNLQQLPWDRLGVAIQRIVGTVVAQRRLRWLAIAGVLTLLAALLSGHGGAALAFVCGFALLLYAVAEHSRLNHLPTADIEPHVAHALRTIRQLATPALIGYLAFAISGALLSGWLAGSGAALGYLFGALWTGVIGYAALGWTFALRVRLTSAAARGMLPGAALCLDGGAATGIGVAAGALLGVTAAAWGLTLSAGPPLALEGFAFGTALSALALRWSATGIATSAVVATWTTQSGGLQLPAQHPLHPTVLAAGLGETLRAAVHPTAAWAGGLLPAVAAASVVAYAIGAPQLVGYVLALVGLAGLVSLLTVTWRGEQPDTYGTGLRLASWRAAGICALVFYPVTLGMLGTEVASSLGVALPALNLYLATLLGLGASAVLCAWAERVTATRAADHLTYAGGAHGLLCLVRDAAYTAIAPLLTTALASWAAFELGGAFGMALAAVAALSVGGVGVAAHVSAGLWATPACREPAPATTEDHALAQRLERFRNAAISQELWHTASAGLSGLALLAAMFATHADGIGALTDYRSTVGMLLGTVLAAGIAAKLIEALLHGADRLRNDVAGQIEATPGVVDGRSRPNLSRAAEVLMQACLSRASWSLLALLGVPILTYAGLGLPALTGEVQGALVTGMAIAALLTAAAVLAGTPSHGTMIFDATAENDTPHVINALHTGLAPALQGVLQTLPAFALLLT